jgi:hypothetical protein
VATLFRMEVDGPEGCGVGDLEAEEFVEVDGAGVFLADVEEGVEVGGGVVAPEAEHQGAGVAFTGVGRVGADAADFVGAGDAQAFAGHGDEISVLDWRFG